MAKYKEKPSHSNDLKSYVVRDKSGKLKFPPTIPKNRTKLQYYLSGFVMAVCSLCTFYFNDSSKSLEAHCYAVIVSCWVEVLYRLILTLEELLNHFEQRYDNNLTKLFEYTFFFTHKSLFLMVFPLLYIIYCIKDHGWIDLNELHPISYPSIFVFVLFLRKFSCAEQSPIYNSLQFEKDNGLDYSSSMAHSFYHGYLRLILPKTGGEDKNLNEIIEVYAGRHNVFVYPKLFILVPKSAVCPVSLEGPNIEESSSLEEKQLTIAGVQKRVYKNSVYKILNPNEWPQKRYYVCAEYATPLRTFSKALEASGKYNDNFKKHKDDIVLHFYLITRDLIRNDPDICDLCELIYYDDRDKKGKSIDVSPIILNKVKKKNKSKKE